ncbi:hypothetical protein EC968_003451 [Mortierella alpina]|nr:hypothetical protein EC968_003451 [Mortierella alpina]
MVPGHPPYSQVTCVITKGTEIFENYREYGCCPWAEDCSGFLFNKRPSYDDYDLANESMEPGPTHIVLSKSQVDTYMQSHLETPVQKALLNCLNEFGSFSNGIWKIAIPGAL